MFMPDYTSFFPSPNALLILEDGTEYEGMGIGAEGVTYGELCFNTAMTGYQEILTDPSYYGQIITFTTPHIGNIGCNSDDGESHIAHARGMVIREPLTPSSNWRAEEGLNAWLSKRGITGISGVDTRALTNTMRRTGHPRVAIAYRAEGINRVDRIALLNALNVMPEMAGTELTQHVRSQENSQWEKGVWRGRQALAAPTTNDSFHVVAIDYGAKHNILRLLVEKGCRVTVMPSNISVEAILAVAPDGVFLSNGPGDPAETGKFAVPMIQGVMEQNIPIFGICLGHQLLALALGAKTEKLHQGHRGANHPVKALESGRVEITSQNHGFVVCRDPLPPHMEVTHISLFDGSIEGIRHATKPAFSVQYHPESSPGPHDSEYLFDQFVAMMAAHKAEA
jgi:carbamoyl-phosphate synthase small subunit